MIKQFCANQNDVVNNFAVVMSTVIKRADYIDLTSVFSGSVTMTNNMSSCFFFL